MEASSPLVMSDEVEAAQWIRGRLSAPEEQVVTSIIPAGFEAYARVLHPPQLPEGQYPLVRWRDVSRWSGTAMHEHVQWHEIALPETTPSAQAPWRSQGPRQGAPFDEDMKVLVEHLAATTSTPASCYFCVWVGHLGPAARYTSSGRPSEQIPAPPHPSRLVQLPWREYAMYEGPLSSATSFADVSHWPGPTANLWWPEDHSWCVASEIDLQWTYVAGSNDLIERILADERIEALRASLDDPSALVIGGWLAELIDGTTEEVLSNGSAQLSLSLGTVEITWRKSSLLKHGMIHSTTTMANGSASSETPIRTRDHSHLVRQVRSAVQRAVFDLVGG